MIHCFIQIILAKSCVYVLYLVLSHHGLPKYVGVYICMFVYVYMYVCIYNAYSPQWPKSSFQLRDTLFKKQFLWSNLNAVREKGLSACTFI